jgi:hypothetical protein
MLEIILILAVAYLFIPFIELVLAERAKFFATVALYVAAILLLLYLLFSVKV